MQIVFHTPMAPHRVAEPLRVGWKTADEIANLRLLLAFFGINPSHSTEALQVLPVLASAKALWYGHRLATSILVAPVIGILGLLCIHATVWLALFGGLVQLFKVIDNVLLQMLLIALHRQHVVSTTFPNLGHDLFLAAHRV